MASMVIIKSSDTIRSKLSFSIGMYQVRFLQNTQVRPILGRRKSQRKHIMKLLLTSAGMSNTSILNALVSLLGKPVSEANAFFIPTAIYGLPNGGDIARRVICGTLGAPFCDMGWKSLSIFEVTAL